MSSCSSSTGTEDDDRSGNASHKRAYKRPRATCKRTQRVYPLGATLSCAGLDPKVNLRREEEQKAKGKRQKSDVRRYTETGSVDEGLITNAQTRRVRI